MDSLKKCYKNLLYDSSNWSYYSNPPELTIETLCNSKESLNFVKEYFKCGEKGTLFDDFDVVRDEVLLTRSQHIISTYLLGIILVDNIKINIEKNNMEKEKFLYLWFLACLFHDVGYIFEEKSSCEDLRILQTDGLKSIDKICNIKYLYDGIFDPYKEDNIHLYLSKRAICKDGCTGVIDHGIVGGFLLYDRLRKNYDEAYKKAKKENSAVKKNSFDYKNRRFSTNHYNDYKKAAQAIIVHNIWPDTLQKYLEEESEIVNLKRIDIKNPIAYILALADTLEPIKRYGIDSLANTYYGEETNGFIYSFGKCGKKSMVECINDLKNWVDVEIEDQSESGILMNEGRMDDEFYRIILRKLNN